MTKRNRNVIERGFLSLAGGLLVATFAAQDVDAMADPESNGADKAAESRQLSGRQIDGRVGRLIGPAQESREGHPIQGARKMEGHVGWVLLSGEPE